MRFMSQSSLTRRAVLKSASAAGLIAAMPGAVFAQSGAQLRMFWWGAKDRAERTEKVNALFVQKNPGWSVAGETLGWADYWPRLATQAAGRNAPDLIQMDYRYIFEYARRGALLPLDSYVSKSLNLADFSPEAVNSGKVDGKIYGVSLGLNSTALTFDRATIEALGLKVPESGMTWAQIADLTVDIAKAAKRPGYFGIHDGARYEPALEVWMRQRGKALYTEDGKIGFDEKDIGEWFAYWDDLRKRGGCASPEVQALDNGEIDTSLLTLGKAAMVLAHSNQLVGFQALTKGKLGLAMYPSGGPGMKPGQYLKPAMMMSIFSKTKSPDEAVKVLDFFVSNVEAGLLLGVERGVPASSAVRKAVEPTLDELGKTMAQYVGFVSDKVGSLPLPPPQGAGEIQQVLRRVNEQIGFGKLSVSQGATQFIAEAKAVLARG
jgi:multiple sugar transport system substrate-binding protein